MHALPCVPSEIPLTGQQATAPVPSGQEGLFAARLKIATERQGNAEGRRTAIIGQQPEGKQAVVTQQEVAQSKASEATGNPATASEKTPADTTGQNAGNDTPPPETSLNQSIGAVLQQLASTPRVDAPPSGIELNTAILPGRSGESAVVRMLNSLTVNGTPGLGGAHAAVQPSGKNGELQPLARPGAAQATAETTTPVFTLETSPVPAGLQPGTPTQPSTPWQSSAPTQSSAPAQSSVPAQSSAPVNNAQQQWSNVAQAGLPLAPAASAGRADAAPADAAQTSGTTGLFSVPVADNTIVNVRATVQYSPETTPSGGNLPAPAIEPAQAPFTPASPPAANSAQPVALTPDQPADPAAAAKTADQLFAVYQGNAIGEEAATTDGAGKPATAATDGQRMDVEDRFISSHLPKEMPDSTANHGDGQQQENLTHNPKQQEPAGASEPAPKNPAVFEQTIVDKAQANIRQDAQPLAFVHQQPTAQPSSSAASTTPTSFSLPSGFAVPEGTVVDQLIAHFSINKRLESGTVNLRLNPRELGELRMEIKVEQDNVKAHIVAQNPQAQEMLDRHLPRLRDALEQQGLNLQQVEVTIAAHDHTGSEQFRERGPWQRHNGSEGHASSGRESFSPLTDDSVGDVTAADTSLSVHA